MKLSHILMGLPVLMLATSTFANTVTYGPTLYDNGGSNYAANAAGSFSVPQFDPSLGTLISVQLTVTGNSYGGSNGFQNLSDSAGSATVGIGSTINVTGPSALVVLTNPAQYNSGSVTAFVGPLFNYSGPDGVLATGTNSTDTESATLLAGFVPYEGLGNVTFNFTSSLFTSSTSTVTGITQSAATLFNYTPTVVYTYAVPEPASLGLLGVGALGLLAKRRRA